MPDNLPVPDLDRHLFRQVLVNLVQNAVEAVPKEGGRVAIAADVMDGSPQRIRLTITDNGPGIPKENAERIFQPLFSTKTKGTGLGLAIVSKIVGQHNGTLSLEHPEEGGARFVMELVL